jgi:hypothetical protein|nr:MAG TPA: hypothetical protein [Caudoviricetes sp.]
MENNIIPISGITRNTDDAVCKDGECMELINARLINGVIEPVGEPKLIKTTVNTYKNIYHHSLAKRYLGITNDGKLYEMPEDLSTETLINVNINVLKVEFIGYSVAAITEEGLRYFLFQDNEYKYLGDLPELPEIKITKSFINRTVKSDTTLVYGRRASAEENTAFNESAYGYYLKCISDLNKDSLFVHATEIRIAFKLFDGSYTKHSPIRLIFFNTNETVELDFKAGRGYKAVFSGRNEMLFVGEHTLNGEAGNENRYEEYVWFSVIGFSLSFQMQNTDLSAWQDIISGIEIFATPSMIYWGRNSTEQQVSAGNLMTESSLFYKIGEFSLTGEFKLTQKDFSKDMLATNTTLADDSGTHNVLIPQMSYVYNARLHIANYMQKLFEGYNKDYLYDVNNETLGTGNITIGFAIRTSSGNKYVQIEFSNVNIPKYFPSFIMYPDARAYSMSVYIRYNSIRKSVMYDLNQHDMLNLSYHFSGTRDDADLDDIESWGNSSTYIHSNDPEEVKNVLKVSNLNNAFFFPADQTYQFNTEIIGMQSNVVAMSQGQFGYFPLYIFTKEGIFAMQVATSGDIVYSSVSAPVTRDVCNNPDSICGLDQMVAFSTNRGLMVINGSQVQLISEEMKGYLPSCFDSSNILYEIISFAGMNECLENVKFEDFLVDCKIGYNYRRNEIIVSNGTYNVCFVYSIDSSSWYKISRNIGTIVNAFPYMWAVSGNYIYDLNNLTRNSADIAIITRPMKFGGLARKKIIQAALRGVIYHKPGYERGEERTGTDNKCAGMYILGSNDTQHYYLVGKKEFDCNLRDCITRFCRSNAYKYYVLCFVGRVGVDTRINFLDVNFEWAFNNRLR